MKPLTVFLLSALSLMLALSVSRADRTNWMEQLTNYYTTNYFHSTAHITTITNYEEPLYYLFYKNTVSYLTNTTVTVSRIDRIEFSWSGKSRFLSETTHLHSTSILTNSTPANP